MSQYTIKKTATIHNAASFSPDWQAITAIAINNFPWYQAGAKQDTQVKLSATEDTLFIQIIAQDNYSYAKQSELNHMLICQDSCVEFFFSPSGVLGSSYVNLEVNCCGTLHLAYGAGRDKRQFISLEAASLIQRKSSISSPVKFETEDDKEWIVEIALPFSAIEQLTGENVNKDKWFANFYRCGGRTEPQYAVWNNIDVPEPDYHRPEHFGTLVFI
ncbi:MAG: carbohydrate-binding family 9-like protein [Colwellia sp.]|uniref:carbohydrate-binding family 9-like protein n=1 Tax=Colwellia sp. TaxID=56799 RepID=UPI0025C3AFE2|nr:carbohydrate-binding family 9-like protein [Colwellia sp.]NQZ28540.1 carbohydrate-binding family 9-like protein [Colwellia sp.]